MTNSSMNGQLELSFLQLPDLRPRRYRAHRLQGAHWWFAQMRAAVDRATDWQNSPPLCPELDGATPSAKR